MYKTITVSEEVVNRIQAADIEQSARREIIVSCIDRGISTDNVTFKQYQDEYNHWYTTFMEEKTKIEREFVTPLNTDTTVAKSWNLNYRSRELVIEY